MKEVKTRWESGNPVTRPEVYNLLRNSYDPSTSFHKLLGSVASIHMTKEGKCFFAHLEALNDDSIYQSLLASNKANNLN